METQANLETEIPCCQNACDVGSSNIAVLVLWWQFSLGKIMSENFLNSC